MPPPFELPDSLMSIAILSCQCRARGSACAPFELRPGATSAIHHAFLFVDETGDARRLEKLEAAPGFPGMIAGRGARNPGGFVSWQPGRRPSEVPEGMAWQLRKDADLILQMHLRPTGKPERVQPSLGLYFTDQRPSRPNLILLLRSVAIDIPAGARDYAIEASYRLPVDVQLIGLLPHMHYLGKEAHGWAELPYGTKRELISIQCLDFDWQSDFRYRADHCPGRACGCASPSTTPPKTHAIRINRRSASSMACRVPTRWENCGSGSRHKRRRNSTR